MSLLQMSVSSAVMILVIILIRVLAINSLPKKTFIALWGIVLLRLLVPFSFHSPFSAYSILNNYVPTAHWDTRLVFPTQPHSLSTTGEIFQEQVATSISPYTTIWGIGIIICAFFFTISYFRCRREFRESLLINNDFLTNWRAKHKLTRPIEIRQSSSIYAPLTYGVFKPIILMPKTTNWDDTKQIEYILEHEFVHIRRFDTATKLFLTAALCIHWFNPMVWAMYILSNRDIELSCDETVVRSFSDTPKSAYARTLISMEEKKNTLTPLCNNFSKNAIEERITAIMKIKKTSASTFLVATLLICCVTTVFATSEKVENHNILQTYSTNTVITQQEQAKLDKQRTVELTKQFSAYEDYGLTYEPKTDSLYYNSKLVRRFSDKTSADNQYFTFVQDNDGIDLRAVRNNRYKLTGITKVAQEEYDKNTQSIKNAHSIGGSYEQGDPNNDLSTQIDLSAQYGTYGVSFNATGDMLYKNDLVRYFCDGVELDKDTWSIGYQYFNKKGIVDVFTKRTVINIGNGDKDPFGNLIGLEKSSQKEFEQRDLSDFSA